MAATPRWKSLIERALSSNDKSNVIQLSSYDPADKFPQVRSMIFRSFIQSSLPNPVVLSTTDIRTPKVLQLTANPWVQLAWWFEGSQEQFRVSGYAAVVPSPSHPSYEQSMQILKGGITGGGLEYLAKSKIDWEAKRKEVFETMSGHMKASWCRPPPGSKLEGGYEESKKWPEKVDKDDEENWEFALGNFTLFLVDPVEIDYVNLKVMPNMRTRFFRKGDGWDEEAVVP